MKETGPPSGVTHLIWTILAYLMEHPGAKDTIEGISTWWIGAGQDGVTQKDVQEAIDWLVSRGWMTMREAHPSKNIYGLCEQNLDQIKTFLNDIKENG